MAIENKDLTIEEHIQKHNKKTPTHDPNPPSHTRIQHDVLNRPRGKVIQVQYPIYLLNSIHAHYKPIRQRPTWILNSHYITQQVISQSAFNTHNTTWPRWSCLVSIDRKSNARVYMLKIRAILNYKTKLKSSTDFNYSTPSTYTSTQVDRNRSLK